MDRSSAIIDVRVPQVLGQVAGVRACRSWFLPMLLMAAKADSAETPQIVDFFYGHLAVPAFVVLVLAASR